MLESEPYELRRCDRSSSEFVSLLKKLPEFFWLDTAILNAIPVLHRRPNPYYILNILGRCALPAGQPKQRNGNDKYERKAEQECLLQHHVAGIYFHVTVASEVEQVRRWIAKQIKKSKEFFIRIMF